MSVERSQIRTVTTLLAVFEKAVRVFRMYPPDHPKLDAFRSHAHDRFSSVLAGINPLQLVVERHSLLCGGETVYSNTETSESLAFLLYKDGIRSISFTAGLSGEEIGSLAAAFCLEADAENPEDDLATFLWEQEFEHIDIEVMEDYFDDYLPDDLANHPDPVGAVKDRLGAKPPVAETIRDAVLTPPGSGEKRAAIPLKQPFLSLEQLDLGTEESEHLKELIADNEGELYFDDMIEIVLAVIGEETDPDELQLSFALFERLYLHLLTDGPLEQALHIIRKFNTLVKKPGNLSPLLADQLESFLGEIDSSRFIAALGTGLVGGKIRSFAALPDLLEVLPPTALPHLTDLLETVDTMKARKLLCSGMALLAARNLDTLTAGLARRPWFVVRNVAYTLGLIGSTEAIPHLGALISHEDPRVRKEALRNLAKIGGPAAADWIFQGIRHRDHATRMQAIRSLPKQKSEEYAHKIFDIINTPAFEKTLFPEKEATYRLLGTLSTDTVIPFLEKFLHTRRRFPGRTQKEMQHLAATSLAALNTRAARSRLRKALPRLEEGSRRLVEECLAGPACPTPEDY